MCDCMLQPFGGMFVGHQPNEAQLYANSGAFLMLANLVVAQIRASEDSAHAGLEQGGDVAVAAALDLITKFSQGKIPAANQEFWRNN